MVNLKSLLDAVTDKKSYEPDVEAILEYVEELKKLKGPRMRSALVDLRHKLLGDDHYAMCHCLELLDFIMKNCSSEAHDEILSTEFLDVVKTVVTGSQNDRAVNRALELMSEWRSAFGSDKPAIKEVCQELDRKGYIMPQVTISAAAYMEKPPAWMEGQRCCQCRTEFKRFLGKGRHHCRNCGKSFCNSCSSHSTPLPRFGIEEPVRVCDICYAQRVGGGGGGGGGGARETRDTDDSGLPQEYLSSALAKETQMPNRSRQEELKEQEELELALAISLNEQENKKLKASSSSSSTTRSRQPVSAPEPTPPSQPVYSSIAYRELPEQYESTSDDALSRYLDRDYWEQRRQQNQEETRPAPVQQPAGSVRQPEVAALPTTPQETAKGGSSNISNPMLSSIKNTLDLFVRRMQEVNMTGRSIATDMSVQTMFQSLTAMHPQLLAEIDSLKREKEKQHGVLQSLDEVKEARVSLDAMRRQHQDKMKQQQEELMMLARMQVEQKRALLQQLKAEDMAYQDLLRQRRQEEMTFQHTMLQQQLQQQRDGEVQQRKAYEQQLLEQQFGGMSVQQPSFSTPPASLQQQQPAYLQMPVSQFGAHSGPSSLEVQPVQQVLPPDQGYSTHLPPIQQSYQMQPTAGGGMMAAQSTAAGFVQPEPVTIQQPMSFPPSQDMLSMAAFPAPPQTAPQMLSGGYPQQPVQQPVPISLPGAGLYQNYTVPQGYTQQGLDMSAAVPLNRPERAPSVKSVELISFD